MKTEEKEKCIGCEKEFPVEEMDEFWNDEPTCKICAKAFREEFWQEGVEHLREYLDARGILSDFHTFCQAKMNNMSEEEIVDLDENRDGDYRRWNLPDLLSSLPPSVEMTETDAVKFVEWLMDSNYGIDEMEPQEETPRWIPKRRFFDNESRVSTRKTTAQLFELFLSSLSNNKQDKE